MTTARASLAPSSPADLAGSLGYSVAEARPPLRSRLWRRRVWIVIGLGLVALLVVALRSYNPVANAPLSIANPHPEGAMAVAEILRDQGVDVREIPYLARARVADPAHTTLVITNGGQLADYQIDSVFAYPGDVVFVGVSPYIVDSVSSDFSYVSSTTTEVRDVDCDDTDALAAERISTGGAGVLGADGCFRDGGAAAYVRVDRSRAIVLLADAGLPQNKNLALEGNAALALRALGHHGHLVWYTGAIDDTTTLTFVGAEGGKPDTTFVPSADFLPRGTGAAVLSLVLALVVAAFWRGRRFGALVPESLPVAVHASESTRGRGRLYRRARATGRATAALRAAAAERIGRRLGLPRSARAEALVAAVAAVSGRDAVDIETLLYGPPPRTETDMMEIARRLDALEREVHRP